MTDDILITTPDVTAIMEHLARRAVTTAEGVKALVRQRDDLLEALKEARDGLAPFAAFADEIDDQSAVAYRTVLYDNCVNAREKIARIDSAIAAATRETKP